MAHKKKTLVLLFATLLSFFLWGMVYYHAVDNGLGEEDLVYIGRFLEEGGVKPLVPEKGYEEQLRYIAAVQQAVQKRASGDRPLPHRGTREPKDVYLARSGFCYDRSRVIEKILRHAGFRVRHIAIYSMEKTQSRLKSLLSPGVESHAVTEVLTGRGWLVVDSNDPWISLGARGEPLSMLDIQADTSAHRLKWNPEYLPSMHWIYTRPMVFVYGLYSRHGAFYPPFTPVPDINWTEFVQNFF